MNSKTILGALDSEINSQTVSRRNALLHTGKLAGAIAVATLPLSLGFMTRKAFAQGPITEDQLAILNFALTLERLEASFYSQGLASSLDFGDTRPVFDQISKHETAHVALLETVLGENADPAPTFDFGGITHSPAWTHSSPRPRDSRTSACAPTKASWTAWRRVRSF